MLRNVFEYLVVDYIVGFIIFLLRNFVIIFMVDDYLVNVLYESY